MHANGIGRDVVLFTAVVAVLLVFQSVGTDRRGEPIYRGDTPAAVIIQGNDIEKWLAQLLEVKSEPTLSEHAQNVDVGPLLSFRESTEPSAANVPHSERSAPPAPSAAEETDEDLLSSAPLSAIVIEGNQRIKTEVILKLIKTSVGQMADPLLIKEDIRTLLKRRWFLTIETRIARSKAGPALVFRVVEKPILEKVTFIGNEKFDDAALSELTGLRPGSGYDVGSNRESARRIEASYCGAGHRYALVTLEKGDSADDREVVFHITEGPKVHVTKISFEGNRSVPAWLLRMRIKSATSIVSDGLSNPDTISEVVAGVKQYYHDLGYFDVQITSREIVSDDRARVHLQFVIEEGERFRIRNITFEGNEVVSTDTLREEMALRENDYFDQRLVKADQQKMVSRYRALARVFASVDPRPKTYEEPGIVDLIYIIHEDEPYRFYRPPLDTNGEQPRMKQTTGGTSFGTAVASATAEPAGLREADHMHFRGIESFEIGDVRECLAENFDLLCSAHPDADLFQYLDTLEATLLSGYRHGGFPEAEVEITFNNSRKRVEAGVKEGKRYRCGDVKVTGAKKVFPQTVTGWLTEDPKPHRILWKKGAPVPFDNDDSRIRARLKSEFGCAGYFYPDFDVGIQRDDEEGIATLAVTINDEGPRAVVGKINVTGIKRDSAADVLQYLDLHPGTPYDSGLCHRLERRLDESGRYLVAHVEDDYPIPDAVYDFEGQPLRIRLREYEDAPPLTKEFSPAEQALLKLREWLDRWARGDVEEDVVATLELSSEAVAEALSSLGEMLPEGWQVSPEKARGMRVSMRIVLGPNHGETISLTATAASGKQLLDVVFLAESDRLILADLARKAKLVLPHSTKAHLIFNAEGQPASERDLECGKHRFELKFGMGVNNESRPSPTPFEVQAKFSPAYMSSIAHNDNTKSALADGIWKIEDDDSIIQIDAETGRPVEWRGKVDADVGQLTIRAEKNALKSELQRLAGPLAASAIAYDAASPWKSVLEFFVDECLYAASQAGTQESLESLQALRKLVQHWSPPGFDEFWDPAGGAREPHDTFRAASQFHGLSYDGLFKPGSLTRKYLVGMFLPMYRRLVPKTGWLWPGGRNAALYWAAADDKAGFRLQEQFLASLDWQIGETINRSSVSPQSQSLDARGFADLCRPFFTDDSWLGKWCVSLAQSAGRLDEAELNALVRFLPKSPARQTVADCLRLLRNDLGQPVGQRMQTALDRLWMDLLQLHIEAAIGIPAGPVNHEPVMPIPDDRILPAAAEEDGYIELPEMDDAPPPPPYIDRKPLPSVPRGPREPARLTPRRGGDAGPKRASVPAPDAVPIEEIPVIPE